MLILIQNLYFKNKENLVIAVSLSIQQDILKVNFDNEGSGLEQIQNFFNLFRNIFVEHKNYFKFIADNVTNNPHFWTNSLGKPNYNAWVGLAYERVCMQHEQQIKEALGIAGIETNVYSWTYRAKNEKEKGAQIDMLIDRGDDVINVCEMKFYKNKYSLTDKDLEYIQDRIGIFEEKTKTKKSVRSVMINISTFMPLSTQHIP